MSESSPELKRKLRLEERDRSHKHHKKHKHKSKHHRERDRHGSNKQNKESKAVKKSRDVISGDDSPEYNEIEETFKKHRHAKRPYEQLNPSSEGKNEESSFVIDTPEEEFERPRKKLRHDAGDFSLYNRHGSNDADKKHVEGHERQSENLKTGVSNNDDVDRNDFDRQQRQMGKYGTEELCTDSRNHRDDRDEKKLHRGGSGRQSGSYNKDERDEQHKRSERMHQPKHKGCDSKFKKDNVLDYEFDFSKHKNSLSKIFFRDQDFISKGSKEFDDFWAFVQKYQAFQKKKAEASDDSLKQDTCDVSSTPTTAINIPQRYDRRYRINLCLVSRDVEDFIKHGRLADYSVDKELTRERVQHFRGILLHYLDFCQKQKFQKLCKIRSDQKNLPIYQYKERIVTMVKEHQIVVVAGDTGCGKSTQMPQYLLEAGFEKIACTQPRRIACISLAKRVGFETLNEYGSQVAFQVRFEKTKTSATRILFLTEGLLLRQMSSDQLLSQYSVIVIDEVHERHIFTDFLLGVLKCLLKLRKDLKLVLMSATININLFSQYFGNAPVIKVPGRLYPIEMEYCPFNRNTEVYSGQPVKLDPTPYVRIIQRIDSKYPPSERGDLLIFLSGMTEIMTVVEAVKLYAQQVKRWIILPLHSALSVEEQDKVFDYPPEGIRKCIVSTNIAETSVTIDGVRFVVDSGKVKEMSFDPKYKMQKLKEFWISRASAEQRKGRAGRTGPGVCFRLFAESDYDEFQAYTTPEIQRVPLDSLVLQLISMGLPNVRKFPFIEPPEMSSIENSIRFLKEQRALAADETLTPIGQMLSMLPVDVVIGKMLIMGSVFHMIDPVLSIAAAMSVQSPFTGKAHVDHDAIAARKSLESQHGDPLTLLNAFDEWIQVKAEGRGTRNWCKRRCLEEQRFYEMTKLKRQFKDLLKDHHLLDDGGDSQQFFTSEQRRQHHGEKKRLQQLKREQQNERKKRKVLKLEEEDFGMSDHEEDKGQDVKDLEFRLTHNLDQLQERSNRSRSFTLRDINLLKIILCSGLFPQIALADDCNTFKGSSEQAFHTKNKPFILLHPTSVFAYQPELLKPTEAVEKHVGPKDLKGRLGSKHELLAYGSLLETNNKPYLVNCMRVPALQTLTLFTNSIDTNADCTRLVCDDWLEIRFSDAESAEKVLSSIITLRSTWCNLLQLRLEDTFQSMDEDREASPRARQLERLLSRKLAEFLDSNIPYALRKILTAEMQHLYVGPGHKGAVSAGMKMFLKSSDEAREHPVKGGLQVNDYLTYNCLLDEASASVWGEYTSHMQRHWICPHCQQSMIVSVVERLQHEASCQPDDAVAGGSCEADHDAADQHGDNPLKKGYFCSQCDKTLKLTATEILRHVKMHSAK